MPGKFKDPRASFFENDLCFEVTLAILSRQLAKYEFSGFFDNIKNESVFNAAINIPPLAGNLSLRFGSPEIHWDKGSHKLYFPLIGHELNPNYSWKNIYDSFVTGSLKTFFAKDLVGEYIQTHFDKGRICVDLEQTIKLSEVSDLIELKSVEPKRGKILLRFSPKAILGIAELKKVAQWAHFHIVQHISLCLDKICSRCGAKYNNSVCLRCLLWGR